ncbi:MAG: hypothetical protein LBC70_07245 [Chitinispirillales bacterium]|nr:hypothetical protein [Chitinispirillales bacterium]
MAKILLVLPILFFIGCAAKIRIEVERPPTLNTSGIRRIAIMPFEAAGGSAEMAQHATAVATEKIRQMNHFTLVDPSVITQLQRSNQSIENHVDAVLIGRLTQTAVTNSTQQGSYQNREGQTITFTDFITDVEVELNYSLVRARDGSLIGPVYSRGAMRAVGRDGYPSAAPLLRNAVSGRLGTIGNDFAPHTVIESRTFATDKSGNKAVRTEMKDALALVRVGNYRQALQAYLAIYERHKSMAAAENASVLHEAFGDVQVAADLMQKVFNETGNPRAREVLARLNKVIQDQETLASEYDDDRGQVERVAAFASEEIRNVLPENARLWIYSNPNAVSMVNAVIDNITADFIRRGVGVVDRENRHIIEAEQKFSMSGTVSDDDLLTVGNAAGANTILLIGLTGTGAMRRLFVRVLDIERGVPILQSDTSERWQL